MSPVDLNPVAVSKPRPKADTRSVRTFRLAQMLLLACVLAAPALMCLHSFDMSDSDIWWHLRTGEWISGHHAVPRLEPFSRPAAGTPWVAYSWAFELLVFKLFHFLGPRGLAVYTSIMVLLITAALYRLVQQEGSGLPNAALLTFACMYSMGHLFTPRPWLFTILLFICEVGILMHARKTGNRRYLVWLPLVFAVWANVHIQFVDGLFVLGLALAEAISSRWWAGAQKKLGSGTLLVAFLASIAATLANPYGWRVYAVARDLASQSGALDKISELHALPFRDPAAYIVLLLAMASAAVLAWQSRILSFEAALLAFAALLSFRSQRDVWLMAVVASAILAPSLPKARNSQELPPGWVSAVALVLAVLLTTASYRALGINNANLQARLTEQMPVRAVNNILQNHYQGTLFNDFTWGGYLIWNLRQPVTIDGRQNVYGDQRMDLSVATWSGQPGWSADPDLVSAGIVIGPMRSPLTQLLRHDGRFQLAYEDSLAAVFTARR